MSSLHELADIPRGPLARLFGTSFLLAALFFVGILHWGLFFQFGDLPFVGNDTWPQEKYYYSVLRASLTERVIPYYVSPARRDTRNVTFRGPSTEARPGNPKNGDLFYETDTETTYIFVQLKWQPWDRHSVKFLGILETTLSPQVALLPLVGLGKFVLVNTWIMYSLGFLGCLLLRKRYQLSLLPFIFLFLLATSTAISRPTFQSAIRCGSATFCCHSFSSSCWTWHNTEARPVCVYPCRYLLSRSVVSSRGRFIFTFGVCFSCCSSGCSTANTGRWPASRSSLACAFPQSDGCRPYSLTPAIGDRGSIRNIYSVHSLMV